MVNLIASLTMTLEDFLRELRETGEGWRNRDGHMRCRNSDCPIIAVYHRLKAKGQTIVNWEYAYAAEKLGMDFKLASNIARAADNYVYDPRNPGDLTHEEQIALRDKLMGAVKERMA